MTTLFGPVQGIKVRLEDTAGTLRDGAEVNLEMEEFANTHVYPKGGEIVPCPMPPMPAGTERMPTAFLWYRLPLAAGAPPFKDVLGLGPDLIEGA